MTTNLLSLPPPVVFFICLFSSLLFNTSIHFHKHFNRLFDSEEYPQQLPNQSNACLLQYKPVFNATWRHIRNANSDSSFLKQPLPRECGELQHTWHRKQNQAEALSSSSMQSKLEQEIHVHQSNCSAPVMRFDLDNDFGLGSHLVLWSQALCNAWEKGYRIQTYNPNWLWLDQSHCSNQNLSSPLHCYFPGAESRCPQEEPTHLLDLPAVPNPKNRRTFCSRLRHASNETLRQFRSASFAYLFRDLSPLVTREAERQLGLLFPETGGRAPEGMIMVHIRWGDKFWEMDLPSIEEYTEAIHKILQQRIQEDRPQPVHIYLATEDPRAAQAFQNATANETNWRIYLDRTLVELNDYRPTKGNRASWATRNTQGRAGLVALGSLMVALEAQDFAVTTQSNWSRLLVALQRELLDRKNTIVVDLRPGDW